LVPQWGISDHATVKCTVQIIDYCFPKIEKKNIRVVDYDHLNTYLNNFHWSPFYLLDDPDKVWESLVGILNTDICLHSSYRLSVRNRQKPWITEKFIAKAKIKRNLWRRYKWTGQDVDFAAHRNYSNNLKCELVQARSRYENNLVSKEPKAIFKYTRSKMISKVSLPVVKDMKGSLCAKNSDTADCQTSFFKSVYVNDAAQTVIPIPAGSCSKNAFQDIAFPISAIKEELQRLKDSSSPGPDEIGCKVLKTNAETLAKCLHHLFSCSFSKSALPSTWKLASVSPIFKKGDKTCVENYRPISLTCICCKIMEKLIHKPMLAFLQKDNVIPDEKHGFLPGKSTITCLLECLNDWTRWIDNSMPIDVVYLDFENAFNKVSHSLLLVKLEHNGIRGSLLKWISAFLRNSKFYVKIGSASSAMQDVVSGVPQGSVLGPLMFLVYISDLTPKLRSRPVLFADDCKIYGTVDKANEIKSDLAVVQTWCDVWKMKLNVEKCSVLHIGVSNPKTNYYCRKNTCNCATTKRFRSGSDQHMILERTPCYNCMSSEFRGSYTKKIFSACKREKFH
jgi:hypothetical protein